MPSTACIPTARSWSCRCSRWPTREWTSGSFDEAGSLAVAVFAGLVVGKLIGIAGAALLALRVGWGVLPEGVQRGELVGLAALGGIGFTVSLFIAELAFTDEALVNEAKVGIFAGSIVSGVLGAALLAWRAGR